MRTAPQDTGIRTRIISGYVPTSGVSGVTNGIYWTATRTGVGAYTVRVFGVRSVGVASVGVSAVPPWVATYSGGGAGFFTVAVSNGAALADTAFVFLAEVTP